MAKIIIHFFVFMFCILLVMNFSNEIAAAILSAEEHGWEESVTLSECMDNSDCSPGEYCAKAEGDCNGLGTCQSKHIIVTLALDPVCGCDGNTYFNAAHAIQAGVNIDHRGYCDTTDCVFNSDCDTDEYCAKAVGDCDGEGICQFKPRFCSTIWDPVCGCDSNSCRNKCFADGAGVNVQYWGECFCGVKGDVNSDGSHDVLDIVVTIRHILGVEFLEGEAFCRADCNSDEVVNSLDVMGTVNVILGIGRCEPRFP
jgi:hypothetical protein